MFRVVESKNRYVVVYLDKYLATTFYNIIRVFASYPEAGLYCQNLIHGA